MKKGKATKLNVLMDIYWRDYDIEFNKHRSCIKGKSNSLIFAMRQKKIRSLKSFVFFPRGKAYIRIAEREAWK